MSSSFRCGYVAIVGPPNAGKSTLLNSMLGQKISIVTAKPQTTRNRIIGIDTDKTSQIVYMDTPGLHSSREFLRGPLGKLMLQAAWQSLSAASLIILVVDGDLYIKKPEFLDNDLDQILKSLSNETRPICVLVNKVDLFHDKTKVLPLMTKINGILPQAELFPVSALKKDGLTQLKEYIVSKLPEAEAMYPEDQVSTAPLRFLAAEIIREKIFELLHQEIPYLTAVEIESWQDSNERGQVAIQAAIYVGRSSHKAMVIGKNGQTLKAIGSKARHDLIEIMERKVHLELWVKVREGWNEDMNFLHELGLGVDY